VKILVWIAGGKKVDEEALDSWSEVAHQDLLIDVAAVYMPPNLIKPGRATS
jgi:hypothetical protein